MTKKNIKNTIAFGGKHAVLHSLNNLNNRILKIYISTDKNLELIPKHLVKFVEIKSIKEIDKLFKQQTNHQGFYVKMEAKITKNFDDLKTNLKKYSEIIILNNVYDDRNIGSVIRSCVAFDVTCLILEKRNYRADSPFMYKSASGAMEYIDVYLVSNLNNTINFLKQNDFWIYCLDGSSKKNLFDINFQKNSAFIFGSEGKGTNQLVKKNSDEIISIPINDKIDSLNLSNSVAVTLSYLKKKPAKI